MTNCPTCGQPITATTRDATWLLELLTNGVPHREVYHARDGGWFVTYGGGQVSAGAVQSLIDSKLIASVYNNCPADAYHVGRTLDIERTMEERKKHHRGKDAPKIYVGDPDPIPTPEQTK